MGRKSGIFFAWFACLLLLTSHAPATTAAYDPLAVSEDTEPEILDLKVLDKDRDRELPIRVYLPQSNSPAPVVLFSHGLGGSCKNNPYLGNHWAKRGYVAVFMQHPGSDELVWAERPAAERLEALKQAAGLQNYLLRVKDVPAVIDKLQVWAKADDSPLKGRMDLEHLGMSGHSFGAVTTQAVSGQATPRGATPFTDPRIKAATMFSPSSPAIGDPAKVFAKVNIPWLLMTGTNDVALIGNVDVKSRLAVFPALPAGGKYELVLDGAEHSAFGDRPLPGDRKKRNPNHHRAILAISTAFWDAYLRNDPAAKTWLDGEGPRSVLEEKDRWQRK